MYRPNFDEDENLLEVECIGRIRGVGGGAITSSLAYLMYMIAPTKNNVKEYGQFIRHCFLQDSC